MRYNNNLTAEYVRQLLDYDQSTGIFTWNERPLSNFPNEQACKTWNTRYCGKMAGSFRADRRRQIMINGKLYLSNRLAWLYMNGEWPDHHIDHKDLNICNDAFDNLRKATNSQNMCNRPMQSNNKSGYKGVSYCRRTRKWQATIRINGKVIHLKRWDTPEQAAEAYAKAAKELHGEFARHD
jgi:hypothetical protein